jgi:ribosomal protein S27E
MRYRCPCHPDKELKISLAALMYQKQGCIYCGKHVQATLEEVRQKFFEQGYILIENQYTNSKTPMRFICPNHPNKNTTITYERLQIGIKCYYCGREKIQEKISGENFYNWKGGITTITDFLRGTINEWKREALSSHHYTCAFTNGTIKGKLHVHHLTPFCMIRDKVFEETNLPILKQVSEYKKEELDILVAKLQKYHKEVVGIPLLKSIHKYFHSLYGRTPNARDFYDFEKRWNDGEFAHLYFG